MAHAIKERNLANKYEAFHQTDEQETKILKQFDKQIPHSYKLTNNFIII